MKEIYIHDSEMPKGCTFCLLNRDYSWDMSSCCLRGMGIGDNKAIKHCPLRSLEQHDKVVRAKAIRDCAEILNDAYGVRNNEILFSIDEHRIARAKQEYQEALDRAEKAEAELAVYKKALELAVVRVDCNYCCQNECPKTCIELFLEQARKEVKQ